MKLFKKDILKDNKNKLNHLIDKYKKTLNHDEQLLTKISVYFDDIVDIIESRQTDFYEDYLQFKEIYDYNKAIILCRPFINLNALSFIPQEINDYIDQADKIINDNESLFHKFYQTLRLFNDHNVFYLIYIKEKNHQLLNMINDLLLDVDHLENIIQSIHNNNCDLEKLVIKIVEYKRNEVV